jgi:hypothetical protein
MENFKHLGEHIALAMDVLDDLLDEEIGEGYCYSLRKFYTPNMNK